MEKIKSLEKELEFLKKVEKICKHSAQENTDTYLELLNKIVELENEITVLFNKNNKIRINKGITQKVEVKL